MINIIHYLNLYFYYYFTIILLLCSIKKNRNNIKLVIYMNLPIKFPFLKRNIALTDMSFSLLIELLGGCKWLVLTKYIKRTIFKC